MEIDYLQTEFVRGALTAVDNIISRRCGFILPFKPYSIEYEGMKIDVMYMSDRRISKVDIIIEEDSEFSKIFNNKHAVLTMSRYPDYLSN